LALLAVLPALNGCATLQKWVGSPSSAAILQTATTVAVGETVLTGKTVAEQQQVAQNILTVTKAVQGALNGDQTTVATLVALAQAKVMTLKLDPQQQLAATTLLAFVSSQLQAKVGAGVLKSTDLVVVNDFAGWVITAATPYAGS
jgi:hypothetical protein